MSLIIIMLVPLTLTSCISSKNVKIASVNGEDITKAEFIYFLTNVKNQIESEQGSDLPEDFWETAEIDGKKVIETAKEKALEEAIKSKISRKKAIEGGYKITSEQYQDINNRIGQLVAKYGNEGVDDYLKQFGLNKNLYQKVLEDSFYQQNLMEALTQDVDEAAARTFFDNKVVRVKHVLISTIDTQTNQPLEMEQLEAAKIKADEILAKAQAGEDFDKLVEQNSEDPGSTSQPEGYYLGKGFILGSQGAMVPAFEAASLELEVGAISDLVESNFGYHIIKRYPNEESAFTSNVQQLISQAKKEKFDGIIEGWKNEAKIEKNEKEYNKIQIPNNNN
jgi:foldase protein PrsA